VRRQPPHSQLCADLLHGSRHMHGNCMLDNPVPVDTRNLLTFEIAAATGPQG
jgi:hypothetical protein